MVHSTESRQPVTPLLLAYLRILPDHALQRLVECGLANLQPRGDARALRSSSGVTNGRWRLPNGSFFLVGEGSQLFRDPHPAFDCRTQRGNGFAISVRGSEGVSEARIDAGCGVRRL